VSLVCLQVFDKMPEKSCFKITKLSCFRKRGNELLIYYALIVTKI
jgi:hypothetical protein